MISHLNFLRYFDRILTSHFNSNHAKETRKQGVSVDLNNLPKRGGYLSECSPLAPSRRNTPNLHPYFF
jgi:hypothetical protein